MQLTLAYQYHLPRLSPFSALVADFPFQIQVLVIAARAFVPLLTATRDELIVPTALFDQAFSLPTASSVVTFVCGSALPKPTSTSW